MGKRNEPSVIIKVIEKLDTKRIVVLRQIIVLVLLVILVILDKRYRFYNEEFDPGSG